MSNPEERFPVYLSYYEAGVLAITLTKYLTRPDTTLSATEYQLLVSMAAQFRKAIDRQRAEREN